MEDNRLLQLIYTLFLGVLIAIFVGVGVNTFYPGPKAPEYPVELNSAGKELTLQQQAVQRAYDIKQRQYETESRPYNRNVSIMTLVAGVALLATSILLEKRIKLISDGIMLGGLFTLIYSIGRGFASQDTKYMFVVVSVGLAVALYLGYHRFVKHGPATTHTSAQKGE